MDGDRIYEFEDFQLDARERRLTKNREVISLTPKAFEVLHILVKNSGRVLEREILLSQVWSDTFVEEATLNQNVFTIRKALGLRQDGQQFIEAVPKLGYRFTAEVIKRSDKTTTGDGSDDSFEQRKVAGSHLGIEQNNGFVERNGFSFRGHFGIVTGTRIRAVGTALGLIALSAGIWFFSTLMTQPPSAMALSKFENIRFSKLTTSGDIHRMAVSPDGKYLAYVETKGDDQALFLRQLGNETAIEIVPPKRQRYIGLTFSPDGDIFFVAYVRDNPPKQTVTGILHRVSLLGGAVTDVLHDIDSPVAISPKTGQLAFIRNYPDEKKSVLIIANREGREERALSVRSLVEPFATDRTGLAWSPDENVIACPVLIKSASNKEMRLQAFDTATGESKNLTSRHWTWIGQTSWLKDGSGVIFPASMEQSQTLRDGIWVASYPEAKTRQITDGINGFFGVSLTGDSNSIVAVKSDRLTSFWATSIEKPGKSRKISRMFSEESLLPLGMSSMSDGRVLFASSKNGNIDIWALEPNGSNQSQLTSHASAEFEPVVAAGGNYIIYLSDKARGRNIWRMNLDGTNAQQITHSNSVLSPSTASDGQWIYYAEPVPENDKLTFAWKISAKGGEPIQITSLPTLQPKISPDGKYIACYYPSISKSDRDLKIFKLTILSADDGRVVKQFDEPSPSSNLSIAWSPDSNGIIFAKETGYVENLWLQPVTGEVSKPITDSTETVFRFAVSSDGKELIYEKGYSINDIVLIYEP